MEFDAELAQVLEYDASSVGHLKHICKLVEENGLGCNGTHAAL
jgi:hypothetical protein